jgi:hypothetical protein
MLIKRRDNSNTATKNRSKQQIQPRKPERHLQPTKNGLGQRYLGCISRRKNEAASFHLDSRTSAYIARRLIPPLAIKMKGEDYDNDRVIKLRYILYKYVWQNIDNGSVVRQEKLIINVLIAHYLSDL